MGHFNKTDYNKTYDSQNTIQIKIKLNRKTDKDIIEKLDREKNKQGYIKSLIRADIEK